MTEREQRFDKARDPLMLQVKLEQMQTYANRKLIQFPKNERFLLCADIKKSIAAALHDTIRMKKKFYKKTTLQDIDVEIDYLRTLIRTAYDLKYISGGLLGEWMNHIDEAGRILGGLMRYYRNNESKK